MSTYDSVNSKSSITSFCIGDDRLYIATRAWLLWLQGLFSTREAGQYHWSDNDTETEILIYDQNPTATEKTGKRPFIVSSRGPVRWANTSRDQTLSRNFDGDQKKFSDIIMTNMTLTCVAKEGVEAQGLAYMIAKLIPVFKPTIMKAGRLHWIGNETQILPETGHGQLIPGSSFPEWRAVQLIVPFSIQDTISAEKGFYNILRAVKIHMGLSD